MGTTAKPRGGYPRDADTATTPPRHDLPTFRAHAVVLALIVAAITLTVVGLAMEDTGIELGALAVIGAAWLVRDSARTPQATP